MAANGQLSNATVFSGFVFKAQDSDAVQVLYNDSVVGNMSISVWGDSCQHFVLENFTEPKDFKSISLEKSEDVDNTIVISFPSGLSVELAPGPGLLQLTVIVPANMENSTQGLLGTYNGDLSDDLQFRNGSFIPSNSSEADIFKYGQTCKYCAHITQNDTRVVEPRPSVRLPLKRRLLFLYRFCGL